MASDAIFRVVQNGGVNFADTFWNSAQEWNNIFAVTGSSTLGWMNTAVSIYSPSGGPALDFSTEGYFTVTGSTLSWSAVPEPSTALAGLLLGAGLLRRRRSGVTARL